MFKCFPVRLGNTKALRILVRVLNNGHLGSEVWITSVLILLDVSAAFDTLNILIDILETKEAFPGAALHSVRPYLADPE